MKIWVTQTGEPYPVQANIPPMRTGLLCAELASRGHDVTWWGGTFAHREKILLADAPTTIELAPNYRLRLMKSLPYSNNRSPKRLRGQALVADGVRSGFDDEPDRPDLVFASLPEPTLAYHAISYAVKKSIPCIVDVRDPWPDFLVQITPAVLRPLARLVLAKQYRRTRWLLKTTDSVVSTSETFLEWATDFGRRQTSPLDRVFYLGANPALAGAPAAPAWAPGLATRTQGKTVFVFLGSFNRYSDLELLVSAARTCAQEAVAAHFVFCGQGDQEKMVADAADAMTNVDYLGWLDPEGVYHALGLADCGLVTVIPGVLMSVQNKLMSYCAYGLAVLSSIPGEMESMLREHAVGFTYAPGDLDGLVAAIKRLVADEELRASCHGNSRRLFASQFDRHEIYPRFADHLEVVANESTNA